MTILILFGLFAILLLIGMPIAFAIGIASAVAAINIFVIDNVTIVQRMLVGINSFPLLAVIFFVFTGVLMAKGGVAMRLVRLSEVVVGRLPGGLAQITVLSSMLFGGVSGSAVAEVSSIGATLIPAMEKAGYTKRYATAVVLTSATMGPIIPPSIPMILYAYVVGSVSVAGLFLAGVVPGVLIGVGLLIACYVHGRRHHHQPVPPMSGRDKLVRVADGLAGMMTLVIILGGIISGIFTATEAGAVGTVYALFLTIVIYKEIKLADLPGILWECCLTNAVVLFLIATTSVFSFIMTYEDVPQWLATSPVRGDPQPLPAAAGDQYRAAGDRPVRRPDAGPDHDGADPVADRAPARHGPDPPRDHRRGQPDLRPDHAAGRHLPVRRLPDRRHLDDRADPAAAAPARDHVRRPAVRDLRPRNLHVAAAHVRLRALTCRRVRPKRARPFGSRRLISAN